jgi:hypothetical protein
VTNPHLRQDFRVATSTFHVGRFFFRPESEADRAEYCTCHAVRRSMRSLGAGTELEGARALGLRGRRCEPWRLTMSRPGAASCVAGLGVRARSRPPAVLRGWRACAWEAGPGPGRRNPGSEEPPAATGFRWHGSPIPTKRRPPFQRPWIQKPSRWCPKATGRQLGAGTWPLAGKSQQVPTWLGMPNRDK